MRDEARSEPVEFQDAVERALEDFILHAAYHLGPDIECSISIRTTPAC